MADSGGLTVHHLPIKACLTQVTLLCVCVCGGGGGGGGGGVILSLV